MFQFYRTLQESSALTTDGLDPADDIHAHDALPFDMDLPGMDVDADDEFHNSGTAPLWGNLST